MWGTNLQIEQFFKSSSVLAWLSFLDAANLACRGSFTSFPCAAATGGPRFCPRKLVGIGVVIAGRRDNANGKGGSVALICGQIQATKKRRGGKLTQQPQNLWENVCMTLGKLLRADDFSRF